MTPAELSQYYQERAEVMNEGRAARYEGQCREACPYITQPEFELRHLWLAGWHDADQELEAEQ